MVRLAKDSDAADIAAIYNHYIQHSVATFEEVSVDSTQMLGRMQAVSELGFTWLVAELAGEAVGYACATAWNKRSAYRHTAEITVYIKNGYAGQGLGRALYQALFDHLGERGIRTVIAGVTLPNPASVALHESFGMEMAGMFKAVGYKFDRWLDVGYWQLNLAEQGPV